MKVKYCLFIASTLLFQISIAQKSITLDDGVKIEVTQKGKGKLIASGSKVEVHYTGYLTDSTKFDSSIDKGKPFEFQCGTGQVIKGWDEAIQHLKKNSKAILTIPAEVGYGSRNMGSIPPNSVLIFEIEILDVTAPLPPPKPFKTKKKDTIATSSGLKYIMVKTVPDGKQAESGTTVSVHYTGYLVDGKIFDSSVQRGEPISFPLGVGRVIKGWDEGIALLKVGEKARLIIPYNLAYGQAGHPPIIPEKATLIFDVELMEVIAPQ